MVLDGGIVLEGGGMRGFYTAGVLDYFIKRDTYFRDCFGVSAGATQGCNYLSGQRKRGIKIVLKYMKEKQYASAIAKLITGDFYERKFHTDTVPNLLIPYDYEAALNSPMNFYAVVTDCDTGKAVYRKSNDVNANMDWIWASGALPFFTKIVEIDGGHYLDGGLADSIPVKKASELNKKNVVVLTRDAEYRKKPSKKTVALMKGVYRKYPNLVEAVKDRPEVYNETLDYIKEQEEAGNLFVIRPKEPVTIGRLEKDEDAIKALYKEGVLDAKDCYDKMIEFFNK
ncbi:MAG: patatin family protein [Lachnospiraceae bacterium]|nr:patatin family protein [Lachnospiraceae bacterium]